MYFYLVSLSRVYGAPDYVPHNSVCCNFHGNLEGKVKRKETSQRTSLCHCVWKKLSGGELATKLTVFGPRVRDRNLREFISRSTIFPNLHSFAFFYRRSKCSMGKRLMVVFYLLGPQ